MATSPQVHSTLILVGVVIVAILAFAFIMSRRAKSKNYYDRELVRVETVAKTPDLQSPFGELSGRKRIRQVMTNEIVADTVVNATDGPSRASSDDLDFLARPTDNQSEQ